MRLSPVSPPKHLVLLGTALAAFAAAPAAQAATADATLIGGVLAFNATPGNVTFPSVTLNGSNQTTSKSQALDISDARGSGVGWHVTSTSTLFTSGADVLPAGSVTIASAPSPACDAGVTCTAATAGSVTYPYTLPTGASAPPATSMYSAVANSGLGAQTLAPTWQLAIPGSAKSGTYTSTWTFSLVSGP